MKKLVMTIVLCCAVFAFAVESKKSLTPEERAARKVEFYKRTGGPFLAPRQGFVGIVDFQQKIDFNVVAEKLQEMYDGFGFAVKSVKETRPFKISDLSTYRQMMKAGAVVFLVDEAELPMSLSSIEARSGLVNIAALSEDNPSRAVLTRRAWKMACRVATLVSGGAESTGANCMMKPVTNLKELDANEATGDEAYVMLGIINGMAKAGVIAERRMTYLAACKENIAPAPTNDVQRKIWDDVHAIPQKPMKIQFDPAAQKGTVTK